MDADRSNGVSLYYTEVAERDLPALADFTCGDDEWDCDLDGFLKEDALEQAEARFSKTYVFYNGSGQLVAYAALSASEVRNQEGKGDKLLADAPYQRVPALLIGRFAVDERHQRKGFGTTILGWIEGVAASLQIGCRFLALQVDERNEDAVRLYCRFGFLKAPHIKVRDHLQLMLYDLKASEQANAPA